MFLCFAFLFQYTWDLEQKIPVMDIALYWTVQLLGCKKRAGRQQQNNPDRSLFGCFLCGMSLILLTISVGRQLLLNQAKPLTCKLDISLFDQTRQTKLSSQLRSIGHFTVVCSVTWSLNGGETGVDLALIQTCFFIQIPIRQYKNNLIYTTKAGRSVSKQGHLQPGLHSKARSLSRKL